MIRTKYDERFEFDVHGLSKEEVCNQLNKTVSKLPGHIKEIVVIHGHKNGAILRDYVRYDYVNTRILSRYYFENDGRTSLFIKS